MHSGFISLLSEECKAKKKKCKIKHRKRKSRNEKGEIKNKFQIQNFKRNIQSENFEKVRHWKYCKSTFAHISQVLGYLGVAQGTIEEYNKRILFFKVIIENIQSENIQSENFEKFSKIEISKMFLR